jgi:carboxyl-terminal processing protease
MNVQGSDRLKVWTPLFFSIILVVGMVLGFNLRDSLRNKRDIISGMRRDDRLEEIISLINEKYVDTINSNALYKDAVAGILKPLDPHTVYIPAEDVQGVNDDLDGGFSGIGVEFAIIRDTIVVTSVVENGPSSHAGVAVGDQLIKVGDSVVAGTSINSARIMHLLRGKQNSTVSVSLKSISDGALKQTTIKRDIIPVYSVEADLMLDDVTGYIKINRFSATTYDEFKKALNLLKQQGAKQLVIDLRDNPGGYLDAVTAMADDFLDDNKLIVYTQGIHMPRTEYRAKDKGRFESGKLTILVDEGSASASEILAGAMQDWDRGVIIGRRTYGKGLVQEQYEMPDGAALRLTTARYYTPSGRCIQRSFSGGRDAYALDYEKRFEDGELIGNDSITRGDTIPYYTGNKRVVYGGGGIKPDIYVPYDTSRWSDPLLTLILSEQLRTTIWDYFIGNKAKLKFRNILDFSKSFNGESQIENNYMATFSLADRKTVARLLATSANREYFRLQVKAQLARFLFHDNGYYAIKLKDDNLVSKAMAVMNSEQYGKILSK